VNEGQRTMLFVSIDVGAGATLYSTFGVKVARVESGANFVDFYNSRETKEVVITSTGGRGLSDIVINEVARYHNDVNWVEIFNKKGSGVSNYWISITWYSNSEPPGQRTWNSSKFNLADGAYLAINVGSDMGEYPPWSTSTTLKLVDDTGATHETYVRFPGGVADGGSDARYIDSDGKPTSTWYSEDTPTKQNTNDLIPEFSDIMYPLTGMIAVFAVLRIRGDKRRRRKKHNE